MARIFWFSKDISIYLDKFTFESNISFSFYYFWLRTLANIISETDYSWHESEFFIYLKFKKEI